MRILWHCDGLSFQKNTASTGRGGSLIKPVDIGSSIGSDRFATWNEVMCAISVSAEGTFALVRDSGDLREVDSDFSASSRNLPEDGMWLAIAREMPWSKSN